MNMSPDDEPKIIKAVLAVAPAESEQTLRSEGVLAIKKTVRCSAEQAAMILQGLEKHKLIEISVALTGGPLDARKQVPQVRLKWTAPPKARISKK